MSEVLQKREEKDQTDAILEGDEPVVDEVRVMERVDTDLKKTKHIFRFWEVQRSRSKIIPVTHHKRSFRSSRSRPKTEHLQQLPTREYSFLSLLLSHPLK